MVMEILYYYVVIKYDIWILQMYGMQGIHI
jgi:hypothetical protein